jgi:hypothetical protein
MDKCFKSPSILRMTEWLQSKLSEQLPSIMKESQTTACGHYFRMGKFRVNDIKPEKNTFMENNQMLSPLRKVKNIEMPLRLKGSKVHKEMIINCLKLVILCLFVPLGLNYTFRSRPNDQ